MDGTSIRQNRGFGWLNATQFLGALNDNVFKLLIVLFIVNKRQAYSAAEAGAIAGAVFVIPYMLFSAWAGKLADRFRKSDIVRIAKAAEVVLMAAGCGAFAWGTRHRCW